MNVTPSASVLRAGYRGWRFSNHAQERIVEMSLTFDEVVDVLDAPVLTYPSGKRNGTYTAVGGRLAVGYDETRCVMTVLWRGKEGRWDT